MKEFAQESNISDLSDIKGAPLSSDTKPNQGIVKSIKEEIPLGKNMAGSKPLDPEGFEKYEESLDELATGEVRKSIKEVKQAVFDSAQRKKDEEYNLKYFGKYSDEYQAMLDAEKNRKPMTEENSSLETLTKEVENTHGKYSLDKLVKAIQAGNVGKVNTAMKEYLMPEVSLDDDPLEGKKRVKKSSDNESIEKAA